MMDQARYEKTWGLLQREYARRGTEIPSEDYVLSPDGVKAISDSTLQSMVIVGLLKRINDLERKVLEWR